MSILFREYELLANSGVFDPDYYLNENPDIAALNIDPLLHYVEQGAREGRGPRPDFDVAYYLEQCSRRGEKPHNPLLHFVTIGALHGLKTQASGESATLPSAAVTLRQDTLILSIDAVGVEKMSDDSLQMSIRGWAIAPEPIVQIALSSGKTLLGFAAYGMSRPDVAASHPGYPKADHSGYSLLIEALPSGLCGAVELLLTVKLAGGQSHSRSFSFDMDTSQVTRHYRERDIMPAPARRHWAPPPMRLEVDDLQVNLSGMLETTGWAVCFLDVAAIRIFIGDEFLGIAEYGHDRDDVAHACPEYPRSRQSGFRFKSPVGHFGPGRNVVKVQALAQSGITREAIFPIVIPEVAAISSDAQAFHFHCDAVELTTQGRISIEGWAVGTAATESIAVSFDSTPIGLAQLQLPRPDVANIFNQHPHAREAGFVFRHFLAMQPAPGEHVLSLTLKDKDGVVREMPLPVQAIVANENASASLTAVLKNDSDHEMWIDSPNIVNGAAEMPITGSLSVGGWAFARAGVKAINIAVDGVHFSTAHYGIRRQDVASRYPDRPDAMMSGFAAVIPNWTLPKGQHMMCISVLDKEDRSLSTEFSIQVEAAPEGEGPWSLRRKMAQAEIDLQTRILAGLKWQPRFRLLLKMHDNPEGVRNARLTLASLSEQAYCDWDILVLVVNRNIVPTALRKTLLADFDDLSARVDMFSGKRASTMAAILKRKAPGADQPRLLCVLTAGDVLGCDALLELAMATGMQREADFFYSDERRVSPVTQLNDAYFKPAWSPDLLLSTNYIGRLWTARMDLLERCGCSLADWLEQGDYEIVLRATEQARSIQHIPRVLCERPAGILDASDLEKRALERALQRRGVKAKVKPGCAEGIYRIKRKRMTEALVSIIIPTCAAAGRVKACLETLRAKTAYRNFEIICIENIPADKSEWKIWLREHADEVIETFEPFNWSRYNNLCAARARGEFLLFLNDDIEIIEPDWLDSLLEQAERPEVGVAGPQLLYGDRSVQHAGLALTALGKARHMFRHAQPDDPGYFGLALTERNVIGVTGACLLTRREVFDAVGGFDEAHTIVNNDVDYCLKTWREGYLNVYTPHAQLIHHELASRGELGDEYDSTAFVGKWRDTFMRGDPYLNPHLSREIDDLSVEREPTRVVCAGHPLMAREEVRRILVVKLDHIGDCLTALPALRRLKELFPQARVSVLANKATKSIWAMETAVDEVLEFDFFHARSGLGQKEIEEQDLLELGHRLQVLRFDLAVDLRKSIDTRRVLKVTGARFLAGFDHQGQCPWLDIALEWEGDTRYAAKRLHIADDLLNLVSAIDTSCNDERSALKPDPKIKLTLSADEEHEIFAKPVVCIHPASGSEMRQWPPEYFAELIDLVVRNLDVHIILLGGPDEIDIAQQVLDAVRERQSVYSLVGKSTLAEVPTLISRCALFVGNNSGPQHIAGALGIPTIGVHSGVIDSHEWGPLGDNAAAIRRDMSCSPCYLEKKGDCPKDLACLRGLSPISVYHLASRLLAIRGVVAAPMQRPVARSGG